MFNSEQKDYMKYLSKQKASDLCWCGWNRKGDCYNTYCKANPHLTAADKLEQRKEKEIYEKD